MTASKPATPHAAAHAAGDTVIEGISRTTVAADGSVVEENTVVKPGIIGRTLTATGQIIAKPFNLVRENPITTGVIVVVVVAGYIAYRRFMPQGTATALASVVSDNVVPLHAAA